MTDPMNGASEPSLTCPDVLDLLYLYQCGELEAVEADAVERHLAECESCRLANAEHEVLKTTLPTGFVDRKLFYYSKNA